ncbi:hypothetical protein SPHINGO391_340011 [Sphingomonas aurantiaca]|jgi:hypothetical protein|uniref:Uncharacterized protein n=2 Tax=Sphingomonas TaxID=13687 RepID=A0A974NYY4_9SPHN|nr:MULTISPECIES: hypothetical protein [Sphingomonas]MDE0879458.1 hypothetical protein [Sphingomonas bacterium]VVS99932.1 hypothetical protein SPHINGO391_340011 [Sphingomonas aurantiaca]VXC99982.1 hypothetical protein SPHINGOT1_280081 [Sphingomonas sp. T1]MCP8891448.1 hypothetical protein [Sphingomonas faeni]QQV79386.1 hypothetical protein H5J25_19380 [Sphingomonas aliaeris]
MAVWIDIARSMARVIVVLAWHVPLATSIPVAVFVEIAGHVARVIVVLSWHLLLPARVAVTVGVEITRRMSGMVVMRAKLLFGHLRSPLLWIVLTRSEGVSVPLAPSATYDREPCLMKGCLDRAASLPHRYRSGSASNLCWHADEQKKSR